MEGVRGWYSMTQIQNEQHTCLLLIQFHSSQEKQALRNKSKSLLTLNTPTLQYYSNLQYEIAASHSVTDF